MVLSVEDSTVLTENGITIRQAVAWDVVKIGRLSLQAVKDHGEAVWKPSDDPTGKKLIATILSVIEDGLLMIAETKEGRIVGMIAMSYQRHAWSDEYLFANEWFYVLPAYRLGKFSRISFRLLEAVERFADSRRNPRTGEGLPVMFSVNSGQDAEITDGLFRSRGFTYTGGNFMRAPHGRAIQKGQGQVI